MTVRNTQGFANTAIGSEYTADELEFLRAMEEYKRTRNCHFPTFCEVLAVAKSLGYRKQEGAAPQASALHAEARPS